MSPCISLYVSRLDPCCGFSRSTSAFINMCVRLCVVCVCASECMCVCFLALSCSFSIKGLSMLCQPIFSAKPLLGQTAGRGNVMLMLSLSLFPSCNGRQGIYLEDLGTVPVLLLGLTSCELILLLGR